MMKFKLGLLGMAVFLLFSCAQEEKAVDSLHSVMTVKPQNASNETVKSFSGVVKENSETNVGFKTAGQIEQIFVKEGAHVRKGQLLACLDSKDYKLGVDASQIQYNQLKNEVARLKVLYESNSVSGNDYEKAVSGLQQLGVQLQANKNKMDYTRLYAPANGIVKSVNFEPSEMVNAGTPVFTLLDVRRLEVEVSLPQSVYMMRSRFYHVYCTANGHDYPLTLLSIIPKADNNQLYTARFAVGGNLTAGQNVNVVIHVGKGAHGSNCSLPMHAVFEDGGKSYVWVVNADSTVVRREVTLEGTDDNGYVVITSGLSGEENVVKAGVNYLRDKEKVKIIQQPASTNVGGLI